MRYVSEAYKFYIPTNCINLIDNTMSSYIQ